MQRAERIAIRKVSTLEGFQACEQVQKEVWGFSDLEVVPSRLMAVISRNGGMVIGAFEGKRMVGFAFSYPGYREERAVHCSHMLAVLPSHANRGIGFRLKQAQRNHVLHRGLDLMLWTFDPLEAKNAHLNLRRLGAVSHEFWENLYGRTSSLLHHGLDTDRLVARWNLNDDRSVLRACGDAGGPSVEDVLGGSWTVVNRVRFRDGLPRSGEPDPGARGPRLALEIPGDAQTLRLRHTRLARSWQLKVRRAFQALFRRGYQAVDFTSGEIEGMRRGLYLLEKRDED
jgi:predicted GNAT superfamily acetyltransferase